MIKVSFADKFGNDVRLRVLDLCICWGWFRFPRFGCFHLISPFFEVVLCHRRFFRFCDLGIFDPSWFLVGNFASFGADLTPVPWSLRSSLIFAVCLACGSRFFFVPDPIAFAQPRSLKLGTVKAGRRGG